ncbi:MAG: hypothetical protein ACI9MC_002606 [Kiritimatiellia bacterium]|jgi:hypothetical protein
MKPLSLLSLILAACASGPTHSTAVYVDQLQPLLVENSALAGQVLEASSDVYNDRTSAGTLTLTWETEVVPMAEHLHLQARLLQPPSDWIEPHQELVNLWGARARGYRALSTAIAKGDEPLWKRGKGLADQAKLDEEKWFIKNNATLAPQGVQLDQFP